MELIETVKNTGLFEVQEIGLFRISTRLWLRHCEIRYQWWRLNGDIRTMVTVMIVTIITELLMITIPFLLKLLLVHAFYVCSGSSQIPTAIVGQ